MRLVLAVLAAGLATEAAAANAECIFQMGGRDVLVGPCEGSERAPTKAFAIASPDGRTAAHVISDGSGLGNAYWNGGDPVRKADILIGTVVLVGACWVSDKTKLCMTR